MLASEEIDADLAIMIKSACYDCHSNKSKHPWYSSIAPVSWWIYDHVEEGREHLNFSEWANYSAERKAHKAEECIEEVEEGEMPMWSYQIAHSEARLSDEELSTLMDWFSSIHAKYN